MGEREVEGDKGGGRGRETNTLGLLRSLLDEGR